MVGKLGLIWTIDTAEPFSAMSSAFLPGMRLSSGMGTVVPHDHLLQRVWEPENSGGAYAPHPPEAGSTQAERRRITTPRSLLTLSLCLSD